MKQGTERILHRVFHRKNHFATAKRIKIFAFKLRRISCRSVGKAFKPEGFYRPRSGIFVLENFFIAAGIFYSEAAFKRRRKGGGTDFAAVVPAYFIARRRNVGIDCLFQKLCALHAGKADEIVPTKNLRNALNLRGGFFRSDKFV